MNNQNNEDQSEFVRHLACLECGSSDANSLYSDGHTHCFSCGHTEKGIEVGEWVPKKEHTLLFDLEYVALKSRKIKRETCLKYSYGKSSIYGKPCQVANYSNPKKICAQHLRFKGKEFSWLGDTSNLQMFGQNLWKGGRRQQYLVITEGEIDCLSVSQVRENKWATCSIPSGVKSSVKAFQNNYDWICSFDNVIIFFDSDDQGKEWAEKCASILPLGKASIVKDFPYKDANDALKKGDSEAIISAIFNAESFSPEGIVEASTEWLKVDTQAKKTGECIPYPFEVLNKALCGGCRKQEIVFVTGGSKSGKSSLFRAIATDWVLKGVNIGYIALEESYERSILQMMAICQGVRFSDFVDQTEKHKEAFEFLTKGKNLFLFDHFGSLDPEDLLQRIEYLVRVHNCEYIFLDHISIVVSGLQGDDRKNTDVLVTQLRSLVQNLNIGLLAICHLRKSDGYPHENGGEVKPTHLRGSNSILQLSDVIIAIERNQKALSEVRRNIIQPRILADRYDGNTGLTDELFFDRETGTFSEEIPFDVSYFEEDEEGGFDTDYQDNNEDF